MGEFGHMHGIGGGACIDGWGAGPFVIEHDGKKWRFGDSDRFGPFLATKHGDPIANPWPSERSIFWRLHHVWRIQGRRIADDGKTCILEYREPRPTKYIRRGREMFIVEHGDHDGCYDGGYQRVAAEKP